MTQKSSSTKLLLWIAAIGFIIFIAVVVAAAILLDEGPPKLAGDDDSGWLNVRVAGEINGAPGAGGLVMNPEDMPPLLTEMTGAISEAAEDETVNGIFLELGSSNLGWAQAQELRDALGEFRAAGKRCIAWSDVYTNTEYFLASACNEIRLAPAGISMVNGLSVTHTYYAGTFEKLGINANFEHVGDFKSAVEPYERTGPSEAAQEATAALLDSLYGQLVAAVADGRRLSDEEARALLDDPPMTPQAALDRGLVDALSYRDEVTEEAIEGDLTKLSDYLTEWRRSWSKGDSTVAVIYAQGAIVSGKSSNELFGGQMIGDRTLRRQLKKVREDDDVKAVVLRVDSPGGSGSASDSIWREIMRTKAEKPVVVSMGNYAASGGYYIAAAGDHIVAQPGTLTGSIGVFGGKLNIAGLYEKVGLTTHTYERGAFSNIFSSISDFNDGERDKYREFLQAFYDTFLERVAEGREMDHDAAHAVAQGRVWTGAQALEHGLVDELGGLDEAIAKAVELASLDADDTRIQRFPERKSFIDELLESMQGPSDAQSLALPDVIVEPMAHARTLEQILADGGAAALLPGTLLVK